MNKLQGKVVALRTVTEALKAIEVFRQPNGELSYHASEPIKELTISMVKIAQSIADHDHNQADVVPTPVVIPNAPLGAVIRDEDVPF